jgi:two-component system, OmpR family, aerobic respiration control sensor histidine kinase ArcB
MLKVLIVEDDKVIQLVHRKLLEKLNCIVETAERGDIAIEMTKNNQYDLIFMDIGLPRVSGVDVIKHIRQRNDESSKTYIIAVTGYSSDEDKQAFMEAGADEIAIKPIEYGSLETILRQYKMSQQE